MQVTFIDTSVFCNVLPVPGRDQDRELVVHELKKRQQSATLILPVTTIIETGNFIAQLSSGGLRRSTALRFVGILRLICENKAPWSLHKFSWDEEILQDLIEGAGTQTTYAQLAETGVGSGDITILAEMRAYKRRSQSSEVNVWTLDSALIAQSGP